MPSHRRALPEILRFATPVLLLTTVLVGSAQSTQQDLEARLKNHPLYLRGQWAPNKLQFDLAGTTSSPAISAPFTLCGVNVRQVKLTRNTLVIDGDRVGVEFENENPRRVSFDTKIQIAISGSHGADYGPALDKIFADGLPALVPDLPFYWQKYAQAHLLTPSSPASSASIGSLAPAATSASGKPAPQLLKILPPNGHLPKILANPEPEFTTAAKILQYRGTSLVHIIVKADGTVGEPYIVRPAGLGMDEEALRAVARYRFKPATGGDGTPVAVELNIEINFEL
jgi:TonB family protein